LIATPGLLDALVSYLEQDKLEEDTAKTLLELVKKLVISWQMVELQDRTRA